MRTLTGLTIVGRAVRRYSPAVTRRNGSEKDQAGGEGTARPGATVIALFGPTGVGKTEVALALAQRLRADGEDPVAVSADALQVYEGLETLTGAASAAERARLEHRLVGFLPVERRSAPARSRAARTPRSTSSCGAGGAPIVVGGTGLYLRAALAELDLRPPPDPATRERWQRAAATARRARPPRAAGRARPRGRRGRRAQRRPADRPHARAARRRPPPAARARRAVAPVDGGHPASDATGRPHDGARGALCTHRRPRGGDGPSRRRRGGPRRGDPRVGDRAQGGRLRGAPRRRRRGNEAQHAPLRQAPAHLDAQAARRPGAST